MLVEGVVVNNDLAVSSGLYNIPSGDIAVVGLLSLSYSIGGMVDSSCSWSSDNRSDSAAGRLVDLSCSWSSDDMHAL